MIDENFRKALDDYIADHEIEETYGEVLLLTDHDFDKSIVGITEEGILVYDFEKMVKEFMEDEKCSSIDAIEWLEYNTLRAIPYGGERHPIIITMSKKEILDKYY